MADIVPIDPRFRRAPAGRIRTLAVLLALAAPQALAAGAAYPMQGREPIEVLADQMRDEIIQRLVESCAGGSCPDATSSWADTIRGGCLRDTVAKHPHGIGGENDLVACMERKSHLSLADPAPDDGATDDAHDLGDDAVEYPPRTNDSNFR